MSPPQLRASLPPGKSASLVGFDDMRLPSFLSPSLTTARAPTEQEGWVAAQQFLRILKSENPEPVTLLPTQTILRQSCSCEYSPYDL